ncbi:MAG: CBS domain-containing protein [Candidatus Aenigmatarchaeota archaeon]
MIVAKQALTINENESVKNAIKFMLKNNVRDLIVVNDKNEYRGIIRLRDLIAEKNQNEKIKKIKKRDCKVYELNEQQIAKVMLQNDCYLAAYLDKDNKVLGSVSIDDLLEIIKERYGNLKVEEIESQNVIILNHNESIYKAIKVMAEYKISHIPIVKNGKLYGIVSSKDISEFLLKNVKERVSLGELIGKKLKIFENPIESIATKKVITYSKNEKISNIIKKFLYYNISCLVKEDLKGIVTKKDLLKLLVTEEKLGIDVIVSGIENVPSYYKENLDYYISNFLRIAKKLFNSGFLKVHIEKHRDIYSIHLVFSDYKRTYRVSRERREFLDVLQECFDALKESVLEEHAEISKKIRAQKILEYLKNF